MPGFYGVMKVGRLSLREDDGLDFSVAQDGRTAMLSVSGQESVDRLGYVTTKKRMDDIIGLNGSMLSVSFSHKSELDGLYRIATTSGRTQKWIEREANIVPWSMTMERLGYPNEVNVESRLSGPVTRTNDHTATGKRWHAPPVNHYAYAPDSTVPSTVVRTNQDGAMTVYYNLGATVNPRWATTVVNYQLGRVRFLDSDGTERSAIQAPLTPTGWTLHNGLVRVQVNASTGAFEIAAWTGGSWKVKSWELVHGVGPAVTMGVPSAIAVLRNDYEAVVVRLIKALTPGRITVDFTLRRGSRFVEVYVQHLLGTTLKLVRSTTEASTNPTGYLRATAADADGNRFVIGSAKSFTADNVNGAITKTATPTLDAFIGVEIASAPAGDTAADLFQQYLGSPAEMIQGVRY